MADDRGPITRFQVSDGGNGLTYQFAGHAGHLKFILSWPAPALTPDTFLHHKPS